MKEIYLDNAATTPCFEEAAKEQYRLSTGEYGNPSSAHHRGVTAEETMRAAADKLASLMRVKSSELIFTSGGTESDNIAILGAARAAKRRGTHIITTVLEHPAVLRCMEELSSEGFDITYLPADKDGIISIEDLERSVSEDTVLVSIMHTNNETGSLQPIGDIGRLLKRKYPKIIFHTDAVQGFGHENIYPKELGVDLLSISGHKFGGPKGVGALYIAQGTKLLPVNYGGGQQAGLRSGTENVPGIAAMALAAEISHKGLEEERTRLYNLREAFVTGLSKLEGVSINGGGSPAIVSASFAGVRSEVLLHALEEKGIYVSAGSACATHKPEPSRTLTAMGLSKELIEGTIRFSFFRQTTAEELDYTLECIASELTELRRFVRR